MMGFELIMFVYPYVKDKKKGHAVCTDWELFTTLLFTAITHCFYYILC